MTGRPADRNRVARRRAQTCGAGPLAYLLARLFFSIFRTICRNHSGLIFFGLTLPFGRGFDFRFGIGGVSLVVDRGSLVVNRGWLIVNRGSWVVNRMLRAAGYVARIAVRYRRRFIRAAPIISL